MLRIAQNNGMQNKGGGSTMSVLVSSRWKSGTLGPQGPHTHSLEAMTSKEQTKIGKDRRKS